MKERLREITSDADAIISMLDEDTIIAGGLALQCILGEKWETSDIDIFTRLDTSKAQLKFKQFKWKPMPKKIGYVDIPGVVQIWTTTTVDGVKFDLIQVTDFEKLWRGFDFDFCKCYFDGTNLVALHPKSVKTRSCVVERCRFRVPERVAKYETRGFKITFAKKMNIIE